MRSNGRSLALSVLLALIVTAGCGGGKPSGDTAAPSGAGEGLLVVQVVNYPLYYFAQRIGGDRVRVEFPAPTDVDPAFWRPGAEQVAGYQNADLVLLNGAGYAKWLNSVSLPGSSLLDTSAGFKERHVTVDDVETHAHGPEGEHEHSDVAFTTWLDPKLALEQARAIEAAFREARPDGAETFRAGLDSLERDLLDLDDALRETVQGKQVPLLGSHPVYQYLAQGYGLEIESVHFEPDEFPGEAAWRDLQTRLESRTARWMLWEGAPLERTAARLQELGVASVVFDPCGNRPSDGDYLTVQRANLDQLRGIYGGTP